MYAPARKKLSSLVTMKFKSINRFLCFSLCIADFLFCLLVLPFSASNFIYRDWIHGDVLCTIFPLMRYGNLGVSLLSIAMISINRYDDCDSDDGEMTVNVWFLLNVFTFSWPLQIHDDYKPYTVCKNLQAVRNWYHDRFLLGVQLSHAVTNTSWCMG